jgi:hypothetical protein
MNRRRHQLLGEPLPSSVQGDAQRRAARCPTRSAQQSSSERNRVTRICWGHASLLSDSMRGRGPRARRARRRGGAVSCHAGGERARGRGGSEEGGGAGDEGARHCIRGTRGGGHGTPYGPPEARVDGLTPRPPARPPHGSSVPRELVPTPAADRRRGIHVKGMPGPEARDEGVRPTPPPPLPPSHAARCATPQSTAVARRLRGGYTAVARRLRGGCARQFGEPVDVNLCRDKKTGICICCYCYFMLYNLIIIYCSAGGREPAPGQKAFALAAIFCLLSHYSSFGRWA